MLLYNGLPTWAPRQPGHAYSESQCSPPYRPCTGGAVRNYRVPRELSNRDLAREAAAAWTDLSRACHHHSYALAPTATELRGLLDAARRFAAEVSRQAASHRSRSG